MNVKATVSCILFFSSYELVLAIGRFSQSSYSTTQCDDSNKTFTLGNESEKDVFGKTDPAEMDAVFKKPFYLERQEAVTLKQNYILHMSAANL